MQTWFDCNGCQYNCVQTGSLYVVSARIRNVTWRMFAVMDDYGFLKRVSTWR
jgi:hypothetical protein